MRPPAFLKRRSTEVRIKIRPRSPFPKPWKWEIYVGKRLITASADPYASQDEAHAAGRDAVLRRCPRSSRHAFHRLAQGPLCLRRRCWDIALVFLHFQAARRTGKGFERKNFIAGPRSVYLLRGASRTEWEHSIPGVESLRYLVTFRSVLGRSAP
jgi:hypothetical protein